MPSGPARIDTLANRAVIAFASGPDAGDCCAPGAFFRPMYLPSFRIRLPLDVEERRNRMWPASSMSPVALVVSV